MRHSYHPAWFICTFLSTRVLFHTSPLLNSFFVTTCWSMESFCAHLYHCTDWILGPEAVQVRFASPLTYIVFSLWSTFRIGAPERNWFDQKEVLRLQYCMVIHTSSLQGQSKTLLIYAWQRFLGARGAELSRNTRSVEIVIAIIHTSSNQRQSKNLSVDLRLATFSGLGRVQDKDGASSKNLYEDSTTPPPRAE